MGAMKPSLIVVGLGNPGRSYEGTRHNAGFLAMEVLAKAFGVGEWRDQQKFASVTQEARIVTVPILLVKPQTYMNLSGDAIRKLTDFYKLNPAEQVLVCSDDIDLPLGALRLRQKGSAGTHNGLKSIIELFGEEVPRLKIGIGPKPEGADLAAWVLSVFSEEERKVLDETLEGIVEMVMGFVMEGSGEKK